MDFQSSVFVFWDNSIPQHDMGRQVLVGWERNMDVKREGTRKWLSWKTSQVTNTLRVIAHKQITKSSELLWPLRQRVCVSALMSPASRVTLPWYKQTWKKARFCQVMVTGKRSAWNSYSPLGCRHDLLELHTHTQLLLLFSRLVFAYSSAWPPTVLDFLLFVQPHLSNPHQPFKTAHLPGEKSNSGNPFP